jgi:hypothetical protein
LAIVVVVAGDGWMDLDTFDLSIAKRSNVQQSEYILQNKLK